MDYSLLSAGFVVISDTILWYRGILGIRESYILQIIVGIGFVGVIRILLMNI